MPGKELIDMVRSVIREELQPVKEDIKTLQKGQDKMQKDITVIKKQVNHIWNDIGKLEHRC